MAGGTGRLGVAARLSGAALLGLLVALALGSCGGEGEPIGTGTITRSLPTVPAVTESVTLTEAGPAVTETLTVTEAPPTLTEAAPAATETVTETVTETETAPAVTETLTETVTLTETAPAATTTTPPVTVTETLTVDDDDDRGERGRRGRCRRRRSL